MCVCVCVCVFGGGGGGSYGSASDQFIVGRPEYHCFSLGQSSHSCGTSDWEASTKASFHYITGNMMVRTVSLQIHQMSRCMRNPSICISDFV